MPETASEDLARRLREAGPEELLPLLRRHLDELSAAAARHALANPYAGREVVETLAAQRRLLSAYEVRRALACHPRAPQATALRFIPGLYWRDLIELGLDVRVPPAVRRSADRYLTERLPSLAVGEKMTIARRAGRGVLMRLRHDPDRRVIRAMLENPRLTEGLLSPLVRSTSAPPTVLALVAESPRWGVRYDVRVGLARNPRTPVETALRLLPHLKKPDLASVAAASLLGAAVRRRARLLLGEAAGSAGGAAGWQQTF